MAGNDNSMDDSIAGGDPNRRRQIRHEYRDLIKQISRGVFTTTSFKKSEFLLQFGWKLLTEEEGDALEEHDSSGYCFFVEDTQEDDADSLNRTLASADRLYEEVLQNKSAREAALDAVLLRTASTITYQHAQKLIVDNKFEPKVFSEKLVTLLTGRRTVAANQNNNRRNSSTISKDAWGRFGKDVFGCYERTPPFHFMLGSFDRGPPVRKAKPPTSSRDAEKRDGPTVRPTTIVEITKSHQEVTSEEVERMLAILRQLTDGSDDAISYFDFVVNPHSFSHTIENIFHMSFLVKDGYVRVELDEDGLPVIYRSDPYDPVKHKQEVPRKQLVLGMNMEEWQEIVEVFEITEPGIPPREQTNIDGQNGTVRGTSTHGAVQ